MKKTLIFLAAAIIVGLVFTHPHLLTTLTEYVPPIVIPW
jgi:hypothetical protein